jgi:hypothetical protein
MNRSAYPLKLPLSMKKAAQRLAREDGVSLNRWMASAVAQKVGATETAAEFFAGRSDAVKRECLMELLENAPDVAATPNDRVR